MKKPERLKKSLAVLVILLAIGLPLACTTNNSTNPTSPIIGGSPTNTPSGPTATFTPTFVLGATATFTPTYIATPSYVTQVGLSTQPNGFYSVPGSPSVLIAEGEVTAGGTISQIEDYTVGGSVNTDGNVGWTGYPTPGEAPVSYVSHSSAFGFNSVQAVAGSSSGVWATLDSPGVLGLTDTPMLYIGDGDLTPNNFPNALPLENAQGSYGGSAFKKPQALAGDSQGHFYVADTGNKRICEVQLDYFAPSNKVFFPVYYWTGSANYQFKSPVAVICDGADDVYVGDNSTSNGVVQEYNPGGTQVLGTWSLIPNSIINGLAVDGNNNFYVSDIGNGSGGAGQVEEYHINGPLSATLVRAWTVPLGDYEAGKFFPGPIAMIGNGTLTAISNILVGDQNTNTIRVFGP